MPAAKPPCRECGKPASSNSRHQVCSVCLPWFCQRCGVRMDRPRAGRHCTDCHRVRHEIDFARSGRLCYLCRKPLAAGWRQSRCGECRHLVYEDTCRALLAAAPRLCRDCSQPLPQGRMNQRCTDCLRQHRAANRNQAPCARCGVRARVKTMSYCRSCNSMRTAWRKAYQQGDAAARLLGRIKRRRKLQVKDGVQAGVVSKNVAADPPAHP